MTWTIFMLLNSNLTFSPCLNMSFIFTNHQHRQCNPSYNRAFIVDWSLSGIMTSKLVICESELPRLAASLILISQMTGYSVIIPYMNCIWLDSLFLATICKPSCLSDCCISNVKKASSNPLWMNVIRYLEKIKSIQT